MSLIKYRPFRSNNLDRFFDDFQAMSNIDFFPTNRGNTLPAVNVTELDDSFEISLAAPGYSKEDFEVIIDQGHLVISVEKEKSSEETDNGRFTRKEFNYSSFTKRFHLSKEIDQDDISAEYENGILKVVLKKIDPVSERKSIKVG